MEYWVLQSKEYNDKGSCDMRKGQEKEAARVTHWFILSQKYIPSFSSLEADHALQ